MNKSRYISACPAQRPSRCADAALKAEIARIDKMSIDDRMRAALALGKYEISQKNLRLKVRKHER